MSAVWGGVPPAVVVRDSEERHLESAWRALGLGVLAVIFADPASGLSRHGQSMVDRPASEVDPAFRPDARPHT